MQWTEEGTVAELSIKSVGERSQYEENLIYLFKAQYKTGKRKNHQPGFLLMFLCVHAD